MTMSLYDALVAWRDREISFGQVMEITGARDVKELRALAVRCGVSMLSTAQDVSPDVEQEKRVQGERESGWTR